MVIDPAVLAVLRSPGANLGAFLRISMTPDPLRVWSGFGDCKPGINAFDGAGDLYMGGGALIGMPEFNQVVNGRAARLQITMSGVPAKSAELADAEAGAVVNKFSVIGLGAFDREWQQAGSVLWLWYGFSDVFIYEQAGGEDAMVRTIGISLGSIFSGRRRPRHAFFTDAGQKARSAGDRFCERTPLYVSGVSKKWPE